MEFHTIDITTAGNKFQDRFYPAFLANEAANTAEAWKNGTDVEPKLMELKPQKKERKKAGGILGKKVEEEKKEDDSAAGEDTASLKA